MSFLVRNRTPHVPALTASQTGLVLGSIGGVYLAQNYDVCKTGGCTANHGCLNTILTPHNDRFQTCRSP